MLFIIMGASIPGLTSLKNKTKQTQAILRRIQHSEPTYDHLSWLEEARRNEQYMKVCLPPTPPDNKFGPHPRVQRG